MARVIVFSIDIKIHSKVGFVEIMGKHVSTRFEINTNLISTTSCLHFIKEELERKKKKNSSFSIRGWSGQLGLGHPDLLAKVLRGEKKINSDLIERLAINLKLNSTERQYLTLRVCYENATTDSEKDTYHQLIQTLFETKLDTSSKVFHFFPDGLYSGTGRWIEHEGGDFTIKITMKVIGGEIGRKFEISNGKKFETKNIFYNKVGPLFDIERDGLLAGQGCLIDNTATTNVKAGASSLNSFITIHPNNNIEQFGSLTLNGDNRITWNENLIFKKF
jgi:hypothetical protein